MVTDVYAHPLQNGLLYIRTDVGGSYRWDQPNSKWIPLNDRLTFAQSDYWPCEGFALDPKNVNVVYYAGGISRYGRNGAIFKSTDKGNTWSQLSGINVLMDGNGELRWADCRLVVSPFDSNVILFGSRYDGLWRSTNAGGTWTKVTALAPGASGFGVQSLAFDPGASGIVYAFVNINGASSGGTVYASSDNGASWNAIGSSMAVRRLKVGPDSALWCTTSVGVSMYLGGVWVHRTPGGSSASFCAIGINPSDADDVIVAREKANGSNSIIYRTADGGTTWTQLSYGVSSTATWSVPALWNYRPTNFVFDPFDTKTIWGDRWRTTIVGSGTIAWRQQEEGHEEDVAGAAIAPPSGTELLVGVFDDDGFAMNNGLDNYPTKKLDTTTGYNGHTWSMAYSESAPATMIRLGYQSFYGGTISPVMKSTDGGATWNRLTSFPANLFPLECAVSATNPSRYLVICNAKYTSNPNDWGAAVPATSPWRYTFDGGATWNIVSGLPTPPSFYGPWGNNQFLAADHVNGSKYYYLDVDSATNVTTGKIYRSVTSGTSFVHSNPGSPLPASKRWFILKTRPGAEGDVWACVDNYPSSGRTTDEGLYRSTDSGVTWTKVSSVNRAFSFGFGKSTTSTPALYVYGRVNGGTTEALYKSADLGATWANITSSANNLSDFPSIIEGSRQTAGRVFVGTGGRGFFYGSTGTSTSTTVSFQQGTNGYAGAVYTTILGSSPLVSQQDWRIYGFGLPGNASHQSGLLQFNNIFGTGAGQVPPTGVTVTAASLKFVITSTWGGNLNLHPMLKSWNPATVTDAYRAYNGSSPTAYWGSGSASTVGPVSGIDFSNTLGVSTPISGGVGATLTADVTNIVQQWKSGTLANNGVVLYGSGAYLGAAFYSPSYGTSGPQLTITYTTP